MASEHHISQVWHGLLDAERLSRYYSAMAARQQRWHMRLTTFVVFGSTGAVGSLLLGAPDWVAAAFAVSVTAAAVFTYFYGHASNAALMVAAAHSCSDLVLSWRDLWARLDGLEEDDAWQEIQRLKRTEKLATARLPAHLEADERLNEQCAQDAYTVLGDEYAVAG